MREFKCSADGEIVDLDNMNLYEKLPTTIKELEKLMFYEIGYSYWYMNFYQKSVYDRDASGQKKRVVKLIEDFTENRKANYDNIQWYREQVYIFKDEIENMF